MEILEYLEQIANTTSQDALRVSTDALPENLKQALNSKNSELFRQLLGAGQRFADMVRSI